MPIDNGMSMFTWVGLMADVIAIIVADVNATGC